MPLQNGQVVLLEASRSSIDGQKGVLLGRDAATGRYRLRLVAEPWRCVKVAHSAIRPLDPSEEEDTGDGDNEAETADDVAGIFDASLAKCDYSLGVFTQVQRQVLPPHVKASTGSWPPSPVKRRVENSRPLPRIEQGQLYRALHDFPPNTVGNPREVHRHRHKTSANFEDDNLEDASPRRAPVVRGRPHRLLPHADSKDLKALVEEDHRAAFNRTLNQSGNVTSLPQQAPSWEIDEKREEEMVERIERIQRRIDNVKECKAAEKASSHSLQTDFQRPILERLESEMWENEQDATPREEDERRWAESEEERITREFKEYEIESLSTHGGTAPSTPAQKNLHNYIDEGFEDEGFEPDLGADQVLADTLAGGQLDEDSMAEADVLQLAEAEAELPPVSSPEGLF